LKREADKAAVADPILGALIATHAILFFLAAFSCEDLSREKSGKIPMYESWKSTSGFIVWVINILKDKRETELEGLWYFLVVLKLIEPSITCDMQSTCPRTRGIVSPQRT